MELPINVSCREFMTAYTLRDVHIATSSSDTIRHHETAQAFTESDQTRMLDAYLSRIKTAI